MNDAEAFLKEGILIDPELNRELKNIRTPLVDVVKTLNIKFLSKGDIVRNYLKIKLILEKIKERKTGEEAEYITQTIKYLANLVEQNGGLIETVIDSKSSTNLPVEVQQLKSERSGVKVLKCYTIPPREIKVADFTEYFKARFNALKSILQKHTDLENLTLINKISPNSKNVSVIGMVYKKSITKNKNILFEIEDLTGKISVLVNVNKPELIEKANQVVLDEVLCFKCSGSSDILFANDLVFPDIDMLSGMRRRAEKEEYAVFISDVHVGSKLFLEKEFLKFIDWINGNSGNLEQKVEALKVKYLFVVGDCVDGIGVYPGQQDKLAITELSLQYKRLAELMAMIRKDITIMICPGQHDGSRVHEPQPPIAINFAKELYEMENVLMVSNPSLISIARHQNNEGVHVMLYHGDSFHPMINEIDELRFGEARKYPTKVIKHWLKKRHLGPMHTTTTHIPIPEGDPLVITDVPDILATGDMHRTDVSNYKGVLTINSSCWQARTDFEEKVGNIPDPCKCPLDNLKTWDVKILDFND